MNSQQITLEVAGADIEFNVDDIKYNAFLNASAGKNKAQSVRNFLVNCTDADSEHRKELVKVLDSNSGAGFSILEPLLETFAPDLVVTVKNSKKVQKS